MKRFAVFFYGLVAYAAFFATFLYAIGFIGNFGVPTSLDGEPTTRFVTALLVNLALLATFAIQHSGMARQGFKRWLTRYIPIEAERSTYVLITSVLLGAMFYCWQPMGGVIWEVSNDAARVAILTIYMAGWALVLVSTYLIDHFDLFGLRQSWDCLRGRAYQPPQFATPGLYKMVRHPLYVGWLVVFWAAPTMTVAHLLFAAMTTAYILIAIQLEERDLVRFHGRSYASYRKQVPMLIPRLRRKRADFATIELKN